MFRSLSGLTTRGRCLLAAGVAAGVCAVILNERDLLRIAVFVVLLPIVVALFVGASRLRLTALRTLVPTRIPAGSTGDVRLELRRLGRLPAGQIRVQDELPYALGARPRFVVNRLPFRRPVVLTYSVRPMLRGVQRLGPLQASFTDPFGLCELDHELCGSSSLMVTPVVVELSGTPAGIGLTNGIDGASGRHTGHGDIDMIVRPYRQGDDLRKVHWRSSARRDEIMVRMEEQPWRSGVTVLLDRRSAAHLGVGAAASLEWAISFAASATLHLRQTGYHVRLVDEQGATLADPPGRPAAHAGAQHDDHDYAVLDRLTTLQPTHHRDIACTQDVGHGQELIAVLGTVTRAAVLRLAQFRPPGISSVAVLLDVPAWDASQALGGDSAHEAAEVLHAMGWRTIIATPSTSMQYLWSRLCQQDAGRGQMASAAGEVS